jgi:tetratricopeptide (TPR) repeat protein
MSTPEIRAYELYRQGGALLANYNEANLLAAIDTFEQALRIEPDDALLRSGLAIALSFLSARYAPELEASAWGRRASAEAALAIAREPDLPEAHLALAYAAGTVHGQFDWLRVIAEADTALSLDSTLALGHVARVRALYHLGLFDLAKAGLNALLGLEPRPSVETERVHLAAALFSGHFAHVSDGAERLRARTDAPAVPMYLGKALFYLGGRRPGRAAPVIHHARKPSGRTFAGGSGRCAGGERQTRGSRENYGPYRVRRVHRPSRRLQSRRSVGAARRDGARRRLAAPGG